MEWLAHHKILTLALFAGVFVVVKAARGSGSDSTETNDYNGPSIIGGPGPVVTMPGGTGGGAGGTGGAGTFDMQKYIDGEVQKMRDSASIAKLTTSNNANKDLIASFLTKINPGKLAGQQINLGYNNDGQITHFDFGKLLTPQTDVEKAKSQALINQIQRNDLLKANSQGFNTAPGTFTDWYKTKFAGYEKIVTAASLAKTKIIQNASVNKTGVLQNAGLKKVSNSAAAGVKINAFNNQVKIKAAAVGAQ